MKLPAVEGREPAEMRLEDDCPVGMEADELGRLSRLSPKPDPCPRIVISALPGTAAPKQLLLFRSSVKFINDDSILPAFEFWLVSSATFFGGSSPVLKVLVLVVANRGSFSVSTIFREGPNGDTSTRKS